MANRRSAWIGVAFLVALLPAAAVAQDEARTFTDVEGRKITAKVLGATASSVKIEVAGGRTFTLPVAKFSEADRSFIRGWMAANPEKLAYEFGFSESKIRVAKERRESGTYEVTEEQWVYTVEVENRLEEDINGLEARYRVFMSKPVKQGSKERKMVTEDGAVVLENLKAKGTTELKTAPVLVSEAKLDPNTFIGDGETNVMKEALEGIQVKLFLGGTRVGEYRSGNAEVKGAEWTDEEALAVEVEGKKE